MALQCKQHENQNIKYVCINLNCKKQRLMCNICQQKFHSAHDIQSLHDFLNQAKQNLESKVKLFQQFICQIKELQLTYSLENQRNTFYCQFDQFLNQSNFKLEHVLKENTIQKHSDEKEINSQRRTSASDDQGFSQQIQIIDKSQQQSQIIISTIIRKLDMSTGHIVDISQAKILFQKQLQQQSEIIQESQFLSSIGQLQDNFQKGMNEFQKQNYKKSYALFDEVLKFQQYCEQAWIYRILSLGELKEYKLAIEQCKKAKEHFKKSNNFYFLHGILLQEENNYKEALEQFQLIIQINNQDQESLYQAGVSSFELEQYQQAGDYFHQILLINNNHDRAYLMLGRIAIERKDYEMGRHFISQCIELNENTQAYYYSASIYIEQQEIQRAKEDNEKFCQIFKDDPKGKLQKGCILLLINQKKEAIQIFNEIVLQDQKLQSKIEELINLPKQR